MDDQRRPLNLGRRYRERAKQRTVEESLWLRGTARPKGLSVSWHLKSKKVARGAEEK